MSRDLSDRDLLLDIHEKVSGHAKSHEEINTRLTSLESSRTYAKGTIAGLSVVTGLVGAWLKGWLTGGIGGSH